MQKLSEKAQRAEMYRRRMGERIKQHFRETLHNHYESAQTTVENERHWATATVCDPNEIANSWVRYRVAGRARYEFRNNGLCKGVVTRLANDAVMNGPTLQMHGAGRDRGLNTQIETDFHWHARKTKLAGKLREIIRAECTDGEALPTVVSKVTRGTDVAIDLEIRDFSELENDTDENENLFDGIRYAANEPIGYHFKTGLVHSSLVSHHYRKDLPRQRRGIARISPALQLFAQLRRFTLATLAAAESAASFGGIMKTDIESADFDEDGDGIQPFSKEDIMEIINLERFGFMMVPKDFELDQFEAKHPTGTFEPFRKAIISESARCLNMPYNVAAADSSDHSYASARLDRQQWQSSLQIEQELLEHDLDMYLRHYLYEWALVNRVDRSRVEKLRWSWFWTKLPHVDPTKIAKANQINLQNGSISLAKLMADGGKDVEQEIAKEAENYGVTPDQFRKLLLIKRFGVTEYNAIILAGGDVDV